MAVNEICSEAEDGAAGPWEGAGFLIFKQRQFPAAGDYSHARFVAGINREVGWSSSVDLADKHARRRHRQHHPRRWSRSTRCWRQLEVVWINQPTDELNEPEPLTLMQAA